LKGGRQRYISRLRRDETTANGEIQPAKDVDISAKFYPVTM
jgi:hypothetical protein